MQQGDAMEVTCEVAQGSSAAPGPVAVAESQLQTPHFDPLDQSSQSQQQQQPFTLSLHRPPNLDTSLFPAVYAAQSIPESAQHTFYPTPDPHYYHHQPQQHQFQQASTLLLLASSHYPEHLCVAHNNGHPQHPPPQLSDGLPTEVVLQQPPQTQSQYVDAAAGGTWMYPSTVYLPPSQPQHSSAATATAEHYSYLADQVDQYHSSFAESHQYSQSIMDDAQHLNIDYSKDLALFLQMPAVMHSAYTENVTHPQQHPAVFYGNEATLPHNESDEQAADAQFSEQDSGNWISNGGDVQGSNEYSQGSKAVEAHTYNNTELSQHQPVALTSEQGPVPEQSDPNHTNPIVPNKEAKTADSSTDQQPFLQKMSSTSENTEMKLEMDEDEMRAMAAAPLLKQELHKNGKPKRPLNAFMIFSRHQRPKLQTSNPNLGVQDIARELSRQWKALEDVSRSLPFEIDRFVKPVLIL